MTSRVYVPLGRADVIRLVADGGLPGPLSAHAVTGALRDAWPDGDAERWEYAAQTAAAADALSLRLADQPPRRYVVAADADAIPGAAGTVVTLPAGLAWAQVAALLADAEDLPEALLADPEAAAEADLAWFATQEIGSQL